MRDYDLFVSNATNNIGQRSMDIISDFILVRKWHLELNNLMFWVSGSIMLVSILPCNALQGIFWLFL